MNKKTLLRKLDEIIEDVQTAIDNPYNESVKIEMVAASLQTLTRLFKETL